MIYGVNVFDLSELYSVVSYKMLIFLFSIFSIFNVGIWKSHALEGDLF